MSLPELQQNPLVQRVIDIFDADGNGEVDFKEFIQGVSQFSVKGDKLSKLKFAFRIYDMDNDGFISNGELFQVSKGTGLGGARRDTGTRSYQPMGCAKISLVATDATILRWYRAGGGSVERLLSNVRTMQTILKTHARLLL